MIFQNDIGSEDCLFINVYTPTVRILYREINQYRFYLVTTYKLSSLNLDTENILRYISQIPRQSADKL